MSAINVVWEIRAIQSGQLNGLFGICFHQPIWPQPKDIEKDVILSRMGQDYVPLHLTEQLSASCYLKSKKGSISQANYIHKFHPHSRGTNSPWANKFFTHAPKELDIFIYLSIISMSTFWAIQYHPKNPFVGSRLFHTPWKWLNML